MILTPKNWKSFQHYKERTPSWIKLHKGLLTDFTFNRLPLASRALAPMLWLLASEYEDGAITASQEEIAFRLHVTDKDLSEALRPLIDSGFFIASEPLAECKQAAIPEKRDIEQNIDKRERKEETREVALSFDPVEFHIFWEDWPNKVGKPAAVKALAAARKRGAPFGEIMDGVRNYIRAKPPDRPWLNPATFLNQNRWEDQPATVTHGRIQETENLSAVARRLAATGVAFGERPATPSVCDLPRGSDVRLLPQSGGERPGDLRSGDGGSLERISSGRD